MKPTREYFKEDIVVEWYPEKCEHCEICLTGLPEVFNFNAKPWVNTNCATKDRIIEQVNKCPSGALAIRKNHV